MTPGDLPRVDRVLQLIRTRTPSCDLYGLRVLDLACRVGAFSTALADAGAEVLGIDARQENLDLAPVSGARYKMADVRELCADCYGRYHVTLCLGILYHLSAAEAIRLLRVMREITTGFAIVDTHIGSQQGDTVVDGETYWGYRYGEPEGPWSAIGGGESFWFTRRSLINAIHWAGWRHISDVTDPKIVGEASDRIWLVIEP